MIALLITVALFFITVLVNWIVSKSSAKDNLLLKNHPKTFNDIFNAIIEHDIEYNQFVQFVKNIPSKKFLFKQELLKKIEEEKNAKNSRNINNLLMVVDYDGVDESYTKLLCDLLETDWYLNNDDILSLLYDIKDPKCINVVYKTALKLPDWDEARSIAKKCIAVLGQVHTSEAKEKLLLLANVDDDLIKEEAILELKNWD